MKARGIGLEFEFPAINLSDGKMISRSQIKEVWDGLGQDFGFKTYTDPATKQPIGIFYKDEDGRTIIVDTDASVGLVEFGFNPFQNLHECHENMINVLKKILPIFQANNIGLLSGTFHPKTPNFYPDFKTEKVGYRVLLRHLDHSIGSNYAAHQVCVDVSYEELMPATNSLLALSGIFSAIFANSSVGENKILDNHDEREFRWNLWPTDHINRVQFPPASFADFADYLKYTFDVPFVAVQRPGSLCIIEEDISNFEYLSQEKWDAFDVINTEPRILTPVIADINEMNHYIYPKSRIKYFFKEQADLAEMLNSYRTNTLDDFAANNLDKLFLENRGVDAQNWDEIMAPSAFILGLVTNLARTKDVTDRKPWSYWLELREKTIQSSLEIEEAGVIGQELLEIAREGLQLRGLGEEVYLTPIANSLKTKKSPAMRAIEEYQEHGMEHYIANRLIRL